MQKEGNSEEKAVGEAYENPISWASEDWAFTITFMQQPEGKAFIVTIQRHTPSIFEPPYDLCDSVH